MAFKNPEAARVYNKKYYEIHGVEIRAKNKQWNKNNKEKKKAMDDRYRKNNREKLLQQMKKYSELHSEVNKKSVAKYNQTPKGKINSTKRNSKHRTLGFISINKPFKGCEGHHVNTEYVVYIPKEIHRSIKHNVWTWYNMDAINVLALQYI